MATFPPLLYVDDDPPSLDLFVRYFEDRYAVHTARSGREALEILCRESMHLLITDQRMPGMTGVELLEAIQDEAVPDMVRMILTGYADIRVMMDAMNLGQIDFYVTKPWDPEELRIVMDRALEVYGLRRRHRQLLDELAEEACQFPDIPDDETTPRPTILYVDKTETHLKLFAESFQETYFIYAVRSAGEALKILRTREIHLLLMDHQLAMSSPELLETVSDESPETLRLLLTGSRDTHAALEAINAGRVYCYVREPWDRNQMELRITLDNAIEVYNLRRRNAWLLDKVGQ